MKMTFLGTGGAFSRSHTNYHNNVLLETDENKILIDCSLMALESLDELGVDPLELDGVIVTHIHGDHVSGLEELGFRGLFLGQGQRFDLITHPNILPSQSKKGDQDAPDLWENCLKGGMMHIQDEDRNAKEADLETYFRPYTSKLFQISEDGPVFQFIQTDHVSGKYSYGLKISTEDEKILFSADARPLKKKHLKWADTIFHDCMFMPHYKATVHTHLEEIKEMDPDIQEKMYLMHYGDPEEWEEDELLDVAKKHQTFKF